MMFNVTTDAGAELTGYLVPDDATAPGVVELRDGDRTLWTGPTDERIQDLVIAGRHATGLCGFCVTEAEAPGLAAATRLEARDADTGMLIYRRPGEDAHVPFRTVRFETSLRPMTGFDRQLSASFCIAHHGVERFGYETVAQLLHLLNTPSHYISGRIQHPPFDAYLPDEVVKLIALREPYEELADRLLLLAEAARGGETLDPRARLSFGASLVAFADVALEDERALRAIFRRLDRKIAIELSNPLARQLTTRTPDDLCGSDAASTAFRTLSDFDVVALREAEGHFEHDVTRRLGIPPLRVEQDHDGARRAALAETLTQIRIVEALLEFDLEIYDELVRIYSAPPDGG